MSKWFVPGLAACVFWATIFTPGAAHACGGCVGDADSVSSVSAHRMALSIAARETVLWDQFQYSGRASDFVWLLPVAGEARVDLADNGFFEALAEVSAVRLTGPVGCQLGSDDVEAIPPPAATVYGPLASLRARDPDSSLSVSVGYERVVGPYETAMVRAADVDELIDWLVSRGYRVPESARPILAPYVDGGLAFVALRFAPNETVDRMQPVRVTVAGVSPMLPLRMVALGVGLEVELELFVLAGGRVETANAPNAEVDRAALTYDWATGTFDYAARFEDALYSSPTGRTAWVTEGAFELPISDVELYVSTGPAGEEHRADLDLDVVLQSEPRPYLTHLRTRLAVQEIAEDLVIAAIDGPDLDVDVTVVSEVNAAPCSSASGSPAREPALPRARGCAVGSPGARSPVLALLALAFGLRARRRSVRPA